ncbi:MAG: hypothetical protein K2Q10_13975, partial [Rhodospirillales bacterium]|nr:hypothetical protein [Rhodospirillales bacterium]
MRRFVLPVVGAFVLAVGIFTGVEVAFTLRSQAEDNAERARTTMASVREFYTHAAEQDAVTMAIATRLLSREGGLREAFLAGDGLRLRQLAEPVLATLRDIENIAELTFLESGGRVVASLNVDSASGPQAYPTVEQAAASGGTTAGLELDGQGRLWLRVVQPWREADGRVLGYIQVARGIEQHIRAIKRMTGADLAVLLDKSVLDRERWEKAERAAGRQPEWIATSPAVSTAHTFRQLPPDLMALADAIPEGGYQEIRRDGMLWLAQWTPFNDITGRRIGRVVIFADASAALQRTALAFQRLGLLTLSGILMSGIFYLLIARIDRR